MKEATLPEGTSTSGNWKYSYYNDTIGQNIQMKTVTYPQGGTITYTFSDVQFKAAPALFIPFSVVTQRKTGGQAITAGTWTYQYETGGTSGNVTTISEAPDNMREVYNYNAWGNSSSNYVWQVGLLRSKAIYLGTSIIYSEAFNWQKSFDSISYDYLTSPSWTNGGSAQDIGIYVPLLGSKNITRDLKTYTTTYSNYDDYDNAKKMQETGGGIDRTTAVDYYWTNTSKNIVQNKPHSVTVTGTTTFPGSFVTSYLYDGTSGNVTQVTRYGVATGYHYDAYGNLDYVTDANNKRTNFDWQYGRVSSKQNPIYTVSRSINSNGTIASETDGRGYGYTTSYGYDDNLRLRSITPPSGYGNVTTIYYPDNNYYKQTSRGGYSTTTTYDGFGRTIGTSDSKGITTTTVYTSYGLKSHETSNVGDTVNYDFFGRVLSTVHRDNTSIGYTYLKSNVTVRDENGKDTTYTYAAFGNPDEKLLLTVTDALPAHNVTQYTYNILGSLTSITQGKTTRSYIYDPTTNFLTSETHPDRGSISYTLRDSVGNIKTKVEPSGTTKFDYDDINRLTKIKDINELPLVSYTYDKADNRATMDNAGANIGANIDYVFDKVNRLHQKTEIIGARTYVTTYDYDANDNLEYITYPSGATRKVHYTYDGNNQAETVTAFGNNVVNDISYYTSVPNIGLPHVYTYANGHAVTFSYNSRNMTLDITAGTNALHMGYLYDDPRGNTTTITNYLNHAEDKTLTYDELNRLRTLNYPWGNYTYDSLGNRQTKTFGSNSTTYIYTSNRLTAATSGETYRYANGDGDLTSINGNAWSFFYDQLHNMVQFKQKGTPVADYTYDGDGMRIAKVAGGKTIIYHYDQSGKVLSENDEKNNLLADYVYLHGKLIAKISPSKPASPTNLRTWVAYTNEVDLYWSDNADNELGFFIERKLTTKGTYAVIGQVGANVTTYSDTDATKKTGTSYTYRVRAFNQIGNSDSYTNEASGIPTSKPLAVMSVSPSSKAFGNVLKGSSSAPTTFTVTNQGSGNLIVTSITGTTHFTVSAGTCSNSTLYPKPDSTCTFTVSFAPTSGGIKNANVTIDTNLPDLLVPVSGNATLKLTVNNTNDHASSGTLTSSPSGIYCGPTCTSTFNTYNLSSAVTLTATPSADSFFAGWSGACTGTGVCQVTMNDHKTVTALFKIMPAVAAFSASTTTVGVIPPTPITFTDQSLRAQSLTWDFDDGIIVTDLTPSANPTRTYTHTYMSVNSTGTYTVSLLATNMSGTSLVTRTITVQPCADLPARINRGNGATLLFYSTLAAAYSAASNNDVIETLATNFIEDFNASRDISVNINGGYACGYATKTGISTLQGTMSTSAGAVTIGDFEIASSNVHNVYNIVATATSGGSISPVGTWTLSQGSSQIYTITPDPNYFIFDVFVDGVSVGPINTYTFDTIMASHTIEAVFATNYTIIATGGSNGTISPSGAQNVVSHFSQMFVVSPATGYHVADVLVDGVSVGAVNAYTFTDVMANHSITASFAINPYTITATAGFGGSISPSGSLMVTYGANQTFTVTPNPGYVVLDVLIDGVSIGSVNTYTFTSVTTSRTIRAIFSSTLIVAVSGSGSVTSNPAGIYNCGTTCSAEYMQNSTVILSASPAVGWLFDGWSGGCSGTATTCTVILGADTTVGATFTMSHASVAGVLYHTMQQAYNAAPDGAGILVRDITLTENLNANSSKTVALLGGYNVDYSLRTSVTVLQGSITTSLGTMTIGNVNLQK